MTLHLDPQSPVPLYHQIAEALRYRIATGKLLRGAHLPPVREAAARWAVNLHTVRHAYGVLAADGLVERRGRGGTVILGAPRGSAEPLALFLDETVRRARESHGLTPSDLARLLADWSGTAPVSRPAVTFVECSRIQAEGHCREIEAAWEVEARPWTLGGGKTPPAGSVVSTYFHYNDLRRAWPKRLRDIVFVAIHPDPGLFAHLASPRSARARTLILCELDAEAGKNIAADLSPLLSGTRVRVVSRDTHAPGELLGGRGRDPVLFSPRVWGTLTPEERAHPRAIEVRYVIAPADLAALGESLGWSRRSGSAASGVSAPGRRAHKKVHL